MAPSLAVILLNYKRPQNIGAIVGGVRAGLPDAPIFLFDQAERDDLRRRADIAWSEVWYQRARRNTVRAPAATCMHSLTWPGTPLRWL